MRWIWLLLLIATPAATRTTVQIVASEAGAPARRGPIEARLDQNPTLYVAVRQGRTWFSDAPKIKGVPARRMRPLTDLGEQSIQWFRIEPRQHHTTTPFPNLLNPAYSNSVLFGRNHGRWLGYDTIEYFETALGTASTFTPKPAMGTIRYRVQVGSWTSPGLDAIERGGIKTSVFRISYRTSDDLIGYMGSLFNVPNVFGSAGKGRRHQTDRHQGTDCADAIVGGARKAGARIEYTSVAGLSKYTDIKTGRYLLDGDTLRKMNGDKLGDEATLRWVDDIQVGDLMLIKYARADFTGRRWDHIGVLAEDKGTDGVFDPADRILHTGHMAGLVNEPVSGQGLIIIRFVRFKRWVRRQMRTPKGDPQ